MKPSVEDTTLVRRYRDWHEPGLWEWSRARALSLLSAANRTLGRTERALAENRVQFVYMHHVFEDEQAAFARLVELLATQHRFISYSEAVSRVKSGDIDAPYVCFSFDDGMSTSLDAARILDSFGARACFFVCPAIIGETEPERIAAFCRTRLVARPTAFMSWADLHALREAGHEIGCHTYDHADLGAASAEELAYQISAGRDALIEHSCEPQHFSWPFGRFENFSPAAAHAVFRSGFVSCASAERGCHMPRANRLEQFCVRRDHIMPLWPDEHVRYFLARNVARARANRAATGWPPGWDQRISKAACVSSS